MLLRYRVVEDIISVVFLYISSYTLVTIAFIDINVDSILVVINNLLSKIITNV